MPRTSMSLTCTLKGGPKKESSTVAMISVLAKAFSKHVGTISETVGVAAFDIKPGVTSDEGDGDEWPALDIWVRRDGKVHHFWGSELGGTQDPGQDPRGAPDPKPLWNILALTPGGRGTDWYPKLTYSADA